MKIKKGIAAVIVTLMALEIFRAPYDLVNNQPHTHPDTTNHDALDIHFDLPGFTMAAASSIWGPIL